MEFQIKRGDTSPSLRFSLIPDDITLAGASVQFQMRQIRGATVIDVPAQIITTLPPVVQHNWTAGQTDDAGSYQAEFRVTYADGAVETFPNCGFIVVNVCEDVVSQ